MKGKIRSADDYHIRPHIGFSFQRDIFQFLCNLTYNKPFASVNMASVVLPEVPSRCCVLLPHFYHIISTDIINYTEKNHLPLFIHILFFIIIIIIIVIV